MAASVLTTNAKEGSTYVVTVAVTDESGAAATPSTMTWTLTDSSGTAINSRTDINFETDNGTGSAGTLSSSMAIILNGSDLVINGTSDETRILTVEGTYNSSYGSGLPYKSRCTFDVENLVAVT